MRDSVQLFVAVQGVQLSRLLPAVGSGALLTFCAELDLLARDLVVVIAARGERMGGRTALRRRRLLRAQSKQRARPGAGQLS